MRKPSDCPRARHPVDIFFSVDGELKYSQTLQPSGFWKDGQSVIYDRIELAAGEYELFIGMIDSGRSEGFDYDGSASIMISEGQHLVVEFDHREKSFIFR